MLWPRSRREASPSQNGGLPKFAMPTGRHSAQISVHPRPLLTRSSMLILNRHAISGAPIAAQGWLRQVADAPEMGTAAGMLEGIVSPRRANHADPTTHPRGA